MTILAAVVVLVALVLPPITRGLPSSTVPSAAGMLSSNEGWMANNNGLYLSSDNGETWRSLVPPSLEHEDPVARMAGIGNAGPDRLWVSAFDVAIRPCLDGTCRGSAIDFSTDGGRTWTVSRLPGWAHCYPGVSMLSARVGVVVADLDPGGTWTYETADGGRTWRRTGMSAVPDLIAPISASFTSLRDGWLSSGPSHLYRTADAGQSWHEVPVPVAPAASLIATGLPHFFSPQTGVVVLEVTELGRPGDYLAVARTDDGGTRWSAITTPAEMAPLLASPTTAATILSASTWVLGTSQGAIETTDAGLHWRKVFDGRVDGGHAHTAIVSFGSQQHGWAMTYDQDCRAQPSGTCTVVTLLGTTDGGEHWRVLVRGQLG